MHIVIDEFKIKYSESSLAKGVANRREEALVRDNALKIVRKTLDRISSQGRRPFVFFSISEGATTLSLYIEWARFMEEEVARAGGVMFLMINTGHGLGTISEEEYQVRAEVIGSTLRNARCPVIVTNNIIRRKRNIKIQSRHEEILPDIVIDNEVFDPYYMLTLYILSIAASSDPLGADLENLFRPGTIHAITNPVLARNFDDFHNELKTGGISFMTTATLGTSGPAPYLSDVLDRVDGCVILGYYKEHVQELMSALQAHLPGIMYCSYAVKPVLEHKSLRNKLANSVRIPSFEKEKHSRKWAKEPAFVFFTAKISAEEALEGIAKARELFKKLSRSLK